MGEGIITDYQITDYKLKRQMKIFLISVFVTIVFSEMKINDQDIFTMKSSPVQDTLIGGIDNELQILRNGKVDDKPNWSICISGGNMTSLGNGKYRAIVPQRMVGEADVWINLKQEKVFEKKFITRPRKTNEH